MKMLLAHRALLTRVIASAALAAGALAACSLGLKSEDTYFSVADASLGEDVATPPEASTSREAAAPPEDVTTAPPPGEAGPTADAGQDAGADADAEVPFDAASLDPAVLQVYYSFELEAGATTVPDESGNHLDALLFGGVDGGTSLPTFDPLGHVGKGLKLDGTQQQYVQLPSRVVQGFGSASVSCWINLATAVIWNRLFDFNNGSSIWMYFSPTGWNDTTQQAGTHFAISSGAHLDPEMALTETVPTGEWHHVAVVLDKPYFFYYLDGIEKYRMTNMTLGPSDLNAVQNWLGRSAFPADPYLSATIDEFRLYSGGLTPAQVAQLASE
jgi:Concanavalin A-like lectin/glucanases superfamily